MRLWSRRKALGFLSALALVALALIGGAVYFIGSPEFEQLAADYTVRLIESRTGTTATLESFEVDFWGQEVALNGLILRGEEDPSGEPLVAIERVEIGFRLRSIVQRRVDLWRLEVQRPSILLEIREEGATNVPTPPPDSGREAPPVEVAIGDFVVSDGSVTINESRIDVDFELADVQGVFAWDSASRTLSGGLNYSGAVEDLVDEPIPYRLETEFDYTEGAVVLRPAVVTSSESVLTLEGRIDDFLGERAGTLDYEGVVDLPFLNYFLPENGFSGTSDVSGRIQFSTRNVAIAGHASSEQLAVDDWIANDFETDFAYDFPSRVVNATSLQTTFAGGVARGSVTISPLPGTPVVELDLVYQDVDPLYFSELFPWGADLLSNTSGTGGLKGWFQGSFDDFDLTGDVSVTDAPAPEFGPVMSSVTGFTVFHARPGTVDVEGLSASLGHTHAEADGVISATNIGLNVLLESEDVRDLDRFYDQGLPDGLSGAGRFEGAVSGSIAEPRFKGDFSLTDLTYGDRRFERILGGAEYLGDQLRLEAVEVSTGVSELRVDGILNLEEDRHDLDVAILQLDAGLLEPLITHPVGGTLTGRVRVSAFDPPVFAGQVDATSLDYDGHLLGDASAALEYGPDILSASDVRIQDGTRLATGDFRYRRSEGTLDLTAVIGGYRLDEFQWLGIPDSIGGRVESAEFSVEGTRSEPQVTGRVLLGDFAFAGRTFPETVLNLRTSGSLVHAVVDTDLNLSLEVDVDASQDGLPLRNGSATFGEFDVGRFAALDAGEVTATGRVTFEGNLLDMGTLQGQGEISTLRAVLAGQTLEVTRPFTFDFDTRRVTVSRVELIGGERTNVELNGTIALEAAAPLDLNLLGRVDLTVFEDRFEALNLTGEMLIDAWVQGTVADPQLGGAVTLMQVGVSHESVSLGLSGLTGDIFLDGPRATLAGVRGTIGGGQVRLTGTLGVGGAARGAMDIGIQASDVRVRTLSGLRTVFNGTFGVRNSVEAPVLEGNVQLQSLSFDESFDRFLQLFDRGAGPSASVGPLDRMALAVHVKGDRNIRVENELASLESRVDLDVGGTFGNPSLTGHAEIGRGTLNIQGRRYRITRGNVDFVDPVGIDPRIDIQAEADIRDYRVILLITGQGNDVQLTMRSDPSLPQLEIVSLVAGGSTRDELRQRAGGAFVPSEEQLFQGAASTILADMLQSRVGSRLGVLNSVRIDPFLVGAENDPVARLTISEQITSDLEITYSQDLSSNSQQIIQIEYFLNGDTSFIASRDEAGRLGLDIKLRKRFE